MSAKVSRKPGNSLIVAPAKLGTTLSRMCKIAEGIVIITALSLGGCMRHQVPPPPLPTATLRERVATLALRQTDFGAISIIPVRFEKSRIAGPFEDGGRTLYCVSARMKGRSFGKGERPKAVIRDDAGVLKIVDDEVEICEGHRTEPFPELESLGNPKG